MSVKTNLHQQIEQEVGTKIEKVVSQERLSLLLNEGLVGLYQEVFSAPPYEESFSAEEVKQVFDDYFTGGGHIFVALDNSEKPIAFVVSIPLKASFNVASHAAANGLDKDNDHYFAEDGVASEFQKKGMSGKLKKLLLEAASISGAKNVLLRTSQHNYKQISAVNKSGGSVIAGVFQDVTSTRQDGSVKNDTRVFYKFDLEAITMNSQNTRKLERVVVARPGGNDTAFVFDDVPRTEQGALSRDIQEAYPGIEQVMFVEKGQVEAVHGQMAGGEFCGNATRSLGFVVGQGKDGIVTLEVSNGDAPTRAEVIINGKNAQTSVPVRPEFSAIKQNQDTGEFTVDMGGIAFLVSTPDQETGSLISGLDTVDDKKEAAKKILEDTGLAQKPASGLLIMQKIDDNTFKLDPFVLVRDTGSLYYESGCGSGSTALGAIAALERGKSVKQLEVVQPSGMSLFVSVERNDKEFLKAFVDGHVEIISDGTMYIANPQQSTKVAQTMRP